jgi:hypothetical protein
VLVSAKQETADKRILKRFKAFHLNLGIVYPPTYKSAPKRFILRYFALSYVLPVILRFTRYPTFYPLSYVLPVILPTKITAKNLSL